MSPADASEDGLPNAFFAFENGIMGAGWTPEKQAETLKALGYAGIGYMGTTHIPARIAAFKAQGLRVFNLYVQCTPGRETPYPPHLMAAIPQLEGTGVVLWLTVIGPTDDEQAARVVGEIADTAAKHGVKVALYPHAGFHVATTSDAVRLVKKVGRDNVGVSLNLCHELHAGNGAKLGEIIQEAMPYLQVVSINGANRNGHGWDAWIKPLGEGDLNVADVVKKLADAGYTGPIGLQCYGVKGDPVENMTKSMEAWKHMSTLAAKSQDLP